MSDQLALLRGFESGCTNPSCHGDHTVIGEDPNHQQCPPPVQPVSPEEVDKLDDSPGIPLDAAAVRAQTDQFIVPDSDKPTLRQRAVVIADGIARTAIVVASMLPLFLGLYVANWSAVLAKETLNIVQTPNGSLVNTALAFGLVVAASAAGMMQTMNRPFLYEDSPFLEYHRRITVGLGILTGSGTLLALNAALLLVALH